MAGFGPRLQRSAAKLIAKFGDGLQGELIGPGEPLYDESTLTATPDGAPPIFTVGLVMVDFEEHEIDGTRVLATDKKVLIAAQGLPEIEAERPKTTWVLRVEDKDWRVLRLKPQRPGSTTIYYEGQLCA